MSNRKTVVIDNEAHEMGITNSSLAGIMMIGTQKGIIEENLIDGAQWGIALDLYTIQQLKPSSIIDFLGYLEDVNTIQNTTFDPTTIVNDIVPPAPPPLIPVN